MKAKNGKRITSKIASHAFFPKNIASNYRIEIRKRILIYYRIREIDKKNLQFLRLLFLLLFLLKLHFRQKFEIILAFVASQSQYVLRLN